MTDIPTLDDQTDTKIALAPGLLLPGSRPRPTQPGYFMEVPRVTVTVVLDVASIPVRQYPLEGYAPPLDLDVRLANGVRLRARVDGKGYRKSVKRMLAIFDAGAQPFVVMQGNLDRKGHLLSPFIMVDILKSSQRAKTTSTAQATDGSGTI